MDAKIIKLVDEAKSGSEKAFTILYNKYRKTIWLTIFNIVKNSDIADDLTSTVFTKVYLKLNQYTDNISFEMWLKTIAVNAAIDYIRKYKYEKLNNYIDDEECKIQLSSFQNSPEEDFILKEKLKLVIETIPTLKKRYRELLISKLEGKSYKEISEKFNITEEATKSLLHKVRKTLKRKIDKLT